MHWTGAAGDSIGARGFAVVAGAGFTGSSLGTLSGGTSGALAAAAGGIGLFAPDGTRVDSVGYGATATTPLIEGAAAPAPASGATIGRIPDGRDTDDNSVDLQLTTRPTPNAANR